MIVDRLKALLRNGHPDDEAGGGNVVPFQPAGRPPQPDQAMPALPNDDDDVPPPAA